MTIKYTEGQKFLLKHGLFNRTILEVSYVEDNTIWLLSRPSDYPNSNVAMIDCVYYKLLRKSNKLYKLNQVFSSYDLVEGWELTEYGSNVNVGYESYKVI